MLYISLVSPKGTQAGVFVRNSGTENKISVNLRGAKGDGASLKAIGGQAASRNGRSPSTTLMRRSTSTASRSPGPVARWAI